MSASAATPRLSNEPSPSAAQSPRGLYAASSEDGEAVPLRFHDASWQHRLAHIVQTMRDVSTQTEPAAMVRAYGKRMLGTLGSTHTIALSRRDLPSPLVRMTRSTRWQHQPDPWREKHLLPVFDRGVFSELIWGDEPRFLTDLRVQDDDPAKPHLEGVRGVLAIPHYEHNQGLNMVVHCFAEPSRLDTEQIPNLMLQSNLFGRGTKNMVLARELRETVAQLEGELRSVQEMQLSLLPESLPAIPRLSLAAHYQTSTRAGGDYYDFFELADGKWGVLVADVSGHGTPAAVLMAIVHAIAHMMPGGPIHPGHAMEFLNTALCARYTKLSGAFVTALYGIYDPASRTLCYANAGHPHPILCEGGPSTAGGRTSGAGRGIASASVRDIEHPDAGLPLGILPDATYQSHEVRLVPGDAVVLYTDGITEAFERPAVLVSAPDQPGGPRQSFRGVQAVRRAMFGVERLRATIALAPAAGTSQEDAQTILNAIVQDVGAFAGLEERSDDRTVVVGVVS